MKKLLQYILIVLSLAIPMAAQQPSTQAPPQPSNVKYVNGVAPGYAPTVAGALVLNIGGGTSFCNGTIQQYVPGTLTLVDNTLNYIYLDTSNACAPSTKTTPFVTTDIPIAEVTALAGSLSIVDVRTPFKTGGGSSGGGITALTGDVTASGTGSVLATVTGINGVSLSALPTGILKSTTITGAISSATSVDIVGLFTNCNNLSTEYLASNGTCQVAATSFVNTAPSGTIPVSSGTNSQGPSPVTVTGSTTNFAGAITSTDTVDPAGLLFTPNGVAPAVTANYAGWGLNSTLITGGFYEMPDAPCTGVVYFQNVSGIVTTTCIPNGSTAGYVLTANTSGNPTFQPASGSSLPTGAPNQSLIYLANGTTATPISSTQATTLRVNKIAGSLSTGEPGEIMQLADAGNSKILGNNNIEENAWCSVSTSGLYTNDALLKTTTCRPLLSYSAASGIVTIVMSDNSDDYIQTGDRFTFSYSPTYPCLYGSFTAGTVTGNTFVFDSTAGANPCTTVSSTSLTAMTLTKGLQLFGMNGAPLASWVSSTGNYGGPAMIAWAQNVIPKGIKPIFWLADGLIATNSIRTGGVTYLQQVAAANAWLATFNASTAVLPNGQTVTLGQYPILIDNGNPMANSGTTWAATQYVFPNGTSGSAIATIPVITSATQGGTSVTTLAAGVPAIVTISYIPNDLWSPGLPLPKDVNFAGNIVRETNPIQMVLDTTGSGVQETVSLLPFNSGTGTSLTGLAPGAASTVQSGYLQGTISFTPANAHTVSGLQIVSTRASADQAYSQWLAQLPYDIAASWNNITPVDFQGTIFGKTSISSNTSLYGAGDELHPTAAGYQRQIERKSEVLAPFINSGSTQIQQPKQKYIEDVKSYVENVQPETADFDETIAAKARFNGTFINPSGPNWCLSDFAYTTVLRGGLNTVGSGFIRIGTNAVSGASYTKSAQTGDVLWGPQLGCWQPTTFSYSAVQSANTLAFTTTGNPPVPYTSLASASEILIRRPNFVDSIALPYVIHPESYNSPINGALTAATTNTFTFSLTNDPLYNSSIKNGSFNPQWKTASQITLQAGDVLCVQGNGGTVATGGVCYTLPVGGTLTVPSGTTNLTWTDTSGTVYAGSGQKIQIFTQRNPDIAATSVSTAQLNTYSGLHVMSAPTPAAPTVGNASTTGGSCTSASAYFYKVAFVPIGNTIAAAGIASPTSTSYSPSNTTSINSVVAAYLPAGYYMEVYGRLSGVYQEIGTSATRIFQDPCTSTPNATYPASTIDNSMSGNGLSSASFPTAVGQIPTSGIVGSDRVTWSTGSYNVFSATYSANTTLVSNSYFNHITCSGTITLTLPAATTLVGQTWNIVNIGTGTCTISSTSVIGNTSSSTTTQTITAGAAVQDNSDGTVWRVE